MPKYSLIVPVFDRPDEVDELLTNLGTQTFKDFEVIIVEDGSTDSSEQIVKSHGEGMEVMYFSKENTGPGDSRNFGANKAKGAYLIFVDSDCMLPENYFEILDQELEKKDLDIFGGPDRDHPSFSNFQKAVNYAMTSFLTTGGIRGKETRLGKFIPRSFNMGIKKSVFDQIKGFKNIHPGEDIMLSYDVLDAGFKSGLIKDAFVYHKRRSNFQNFWQQTYKFGIVRGILVKKYPKRFKVTYILPSLFFIAFSLSILGIGFPLKLFIFYAMLILAQVYLKTKSVNMAFLSVVASFCQLIAYGYGFLKSTFLLFLLKKQEKKVFKKIFYKEES